MTAISGQIRSVIVERVEPRVAMGEVLRAWFRRPGAVVLDGSQPEHPGGRCSILAFDPVETIRVGHAVPPIDPLERLAAAISTAYPWTASTKVPFLGGWIGFLSYESGLSHEGLSSRKRPDPWLPAAEFRLYDTALVFDQEGDNCSVVAIDWRRGIHRERGPAASRIQRCLDWLSTVDSSDRERMRTVGDAVGGRSATTGVCACRANLTRQEYLRRVRRVQSYIAAGDIYQANLSMRFTASTDVEPADLYLRLRSASPAPYAAYFPTPNATILCASPELFLDVQSREVRTRPIKGTRPRLGSALPDGLACRELGVDPKESAELAMIVDLLRNDLGRVCESGSVRVEDPGSIEPHGTVFHRVATVTGRLRGDRTWLDLLRSAFPGGSITGAPKIRAMQILDELEPTPRGAYCGAIGWFGVDGRVCLNVAIRSMVHVGGKVHMYAGGAITADSDPEREYEEILQKALGMFRAVGCAPKSERRLRGPGRVRVVA